MKYIRNFCIIAHIDHGKSTLSDRLIEFCNYLPSKNKCNQILDSMEIEKERGITIKSSCINLEYKYIDNKIYKLNLIDTPGHVDFSYEAFRAIYACEGAILLIDVTQGVQAQTIEKYRIAVENNLYIIPVFNKIDKYDHDHISILVENTKKIFKNKLTNFLMCSAKTGEGVDILLNNIIKYIPMPQGNILLPLQAIIIDSWVDDYLGVICIIRIKNGLIKKFDKIKLMNSKTIYIVSKLGYLKPNRIEFNELKCGEIGWIIISGIRNLKKFLVGEIITLKNNSNTNILPKFKKIKPQIYAFLYPLNKKFYQNLKIALLKLSFNDAALQYEKHNSNYLGLGFKCGFLGVLHMEIIQERLKREYKIEIIITSPRVTYQVILKKNNHIIEIFSPLQLSQKDLIKEIREPIAICDILIPKIYFSKILQLCIKKRGVQKKILYKNNQVYMNYEIPLLEIITDFYQQLQILSQGYASLDYKFLKYIKSPIIILNVLINKKKIDEFQFFIHSVNAKKYAINLVSKIKKCMPRQQFEIIIQASINKKIFISDIIKPFKKNVISNCYGGDVSRKKKLLIKQKKGKNKMKHIGKILIPEKVFLSIFNK